jgi:sugar/nucleoside kinase (ribokinase family)
MIPHDPTGAPLAVVAGHVCLDVIPELRGPVTLRPGHLVTAGRATLSTGGAVANVGSALHRLGVPVRLVGKIGDDVFGRAVCESLQACGPGLADGMIIAAGEATSYSIVISPPGVDRAFLHCPGANDTFGVEDLSPDALAGIRIFHFGYPPLMRRMYEDGGAHLRALLARARTAGAITSLDLADPDPDGPASHVDWAGLLDHIMDVVDVFVPSLGELVFMLDRDRHAPGTGLGELDRGLLAEMAGRALAMGAAIVALKLGDQGLYVRTTADPARLERVCTTLGLNPSDWCDREVLAPCFVARRPAGTTGAGDSAIAGLLAALLRGADPVSAATGATAVGACSVEASDATGGVPPWPDVARRLEDGWARAPLPDTLTAGIAWQTDGLGTHFDPTT